MTVNIGSSRLLAKPSQRKAALATTRPGVPIGGPAVILILLALRDAPSEPELVDGSALLKRIDDEVALGGGER